MNMTHGISLPRWVSFGWFLLLLAVASCPAMADDAKNLHPNGGFENWPDQPDENPSWGAVGFSVGVEGRDDTPEPGRAFRTGEGELDTTRRSGKYAQYIQTTTWGRGAIARGVSATAGHRYRISVWARTMTGKFQLGICYSHAPWSYFGDWVFGGANGRWTQYTKEIVIPEDCKGFATVMFIQSGVVYLDDFEVVDLGSAESASGEVDRLPLLEGKLAPGISRKRIALLDEPTFPSESPRPIDWYEKVLKDAGLLVTRLNVKALCDPAQFSRDQFDTFLLATGGNFPTDAEAQIERFLARGGTVVVDEHHYYHTSGTPPDKAAEIARLKREYLSGNSGYAYFDYVSKHQQVPYANMFHFDERSQQWHTSLRRNQSYEGPNKATYARGLNLQPWPNTAEAHYARPFDTPLAANPAASAVMGSLPANIPPDDNPAQARGAIRLSRPGPLRGAGAGQSDEFACDLLLPLYLFAKPSNLSYPAFKEMGKSEKDRESDFYIHRQHNFRADGGTLVHFGLTGAKLLRSSNGADILLTTLRIAESQLPGECPSQYVATANQARQRFSDYADRSLQYRRQIATLATSATYRGDTKELASHQETFDQERRQFRQISDRASELNSLLLKRDEGYAYGHRARTALVADLDKQIARLDSRIEELQRSVDQVINEPTDVPVRSFLKRIFFGIDNAERRGPASLAELRQRLESWGMRYEGYGITSYRHEYTFNSHPFKTHFDSGHLNPSSGVVTPRRYHWMETIENLARWQESFRWQLERAASDPEITLIYGLDESDLEWSLWGPRMRSLFHEYIEKKHRSVQQMNKVWHTNYKAFDEVELPVQQPQTQTAHAIWEDWTRFREWYRLNREIFPSGDTVRRYAPNLRYLTWSTYNQHDKHPASGINFYQYGKSVGPVNGFEHSNTQRKEWLTFDICSMFSRNVTAEWGTFYFPPKPHQDKIDLLTERLWRGLVNGQAGWSLFICSTPGATESNAFDMMNLPLPLGRQLIHLNDVFKQIDHIILDGQREEAPVRIVYSPTTHRHTSWPGVANDLSFQAVDGLYSLFNHSHIHARAIDEQAIWEGHLSPECRLLVMSEVTYEQVILHDAVQRYLEQGGNVLVTTGSGRFDEYGRRRDGWLAEAAVTRGRVAEKVISVSEEQRYFSARHADDMVSLLPVLEDEVQVLQRYTDGSPALTETRVGRGRLFVIGVNLGMDCQHQYKANPGAPMALLAPVLERAGVEREYLVSDPTILVRPWVYDGERYLILTSSSREGIQEYDFAIRGSWAVKDYLAGANVPITYDGTYSRMRGVIASPGSVVLALEAAELPVKVVRADKPQAPRQMTAPESAYHPVDEAHPFEGRLWARDGTIKMGDFTFEIDVETGGGWGGKTYLTATHGSERQRKLCEANKPVDFHFTERVVRVDCREVVSVYPVNILCHITVSPTPSIKSECKVKTEPFFGMDSIVITNGLLRARVLPDLGGRIVELTTLPDETNHVYLNKAVAAKGINRTSVEIGGLKENPGGYPGPYWDAPFVATVVENTPQRAVLKLAMEHPIAWGYGYAKPKSGRNRLEKQLILRQGESTLDIQLRAFNETPDTKPTGLRTHSSWTIGGDGDGADQWTFNKDGRAVTTGHPFTGTYPAQGKWSAIADTAKRMTLVQIFDPTMTESIYTTGRTHYNLELWAKVRDIASGASLDFDHQLVLIRGLSGVTTYESGVAIHIGMPTASKAAQEAAPAFKVEIGGSLATTGTLTVQIERDGKIVSDLGQHEVRTEPGRAETITVEWDRRSTVDGTFQVVAQFQADDPDLQVKAARQIDITAGRIRQELAGLASYDQQVRELKREYAKQMAIPSTTSSIRELRQRVTRAAVLIAELRIAIGAGQQEEAKRLEAELGKLLASR